MNLFLDLPTLLMVFTIIFVTVYMAYRIGYRKGGNVAFDYCTRVINEVADEKIKELESMQNRKN